MSCAFQGFIWRLLRLHAALQAAHDQRPGSAPELNHFHTIFDDDMMAGLLDYDQGGLQSEGFALPEGFVLPDEGPAMPAGPAHRSPPLPREGFSMHGEGIGLPPRAMAARGLGKAHSASLASVYHIQANCSHEVYPARTSSNHPLHAFPVHKSSTRLSAVRWLGKAHSARLASISHRSREARLPYQQVIAVLFI